MEYRVYTLICPISNNVFYVGMTTKSLSERLKRHVHDTGNIVKAKFIFSLMEKELLPTIELIESFDLEQNARYFEKYWISQFRSWGFNLLNKQTYIKGNRPFRTSIKQYWESYNQFIEYKNNYKLRKWLSNG